MATKDRIKELRRVPASELIPNLKNWRTHPQAQRDALRGVLAEIGFVDALIARETPKHNPEEMGLFRDPFVWRDTENWLTGLAGSS